MSVSKHYIGKAGEHFVSGHLLAREIPVSEPIVDVGIDLIAGNGVRIQVKASRRHEYRCGAYVFTLAKQHPIKGHKQYWTKVPNWSKMVDFVVCVGLDDMKFWVIPASVMAKYQGVQTLMLGGRHRRLVEYDKVPELLAAGRTQMEIGKMLGVSTASVGNIVRGWVPKEINQNLLSREADKYENAWHEIESAVKLATQIDEIPSIEELLSEGELEAAEQITGRKFSGE